MIMLHKLESKILTESDNLSKEEKKLKEEIKILSENGKNKLDSKILKEKLKEIRLKAA